MDSCSPGSEDEFQLLTRLLPTVLELWVFDVLLASLFFRRVEFENGGAEEGGDVTAELLVVSGCQSTPYTSDSDERFSRYGVCNFGSRRIRFGDRSSQTVNFFHVLDGGFGPEGQVGLCLRVDTPLR